MSKEYKKVATIMYTSNFDASRGSFLVYKQEKEYLIIRKFKTQREKEEISLIDWDSFIEGYFNLRDKKQFKMTEHYLDKEFQEIIQMIEAAKKI